MAMFCSELAIPVLTSLMAADGKESGIDSRSVMLGPLGGVVINGVCQRFQHMIKGVIYCPTVCGHPRERWVLPGFAGFPLFGSRSSEISLACFGQTLGMEAFT